VNERDRAIERAVASFRALADLAETVEDEWQYVTDLVDAYLPSIHALAEGDAGQPLTAEAMAAVDEAIAEVGLKTDPHKAIDWLSTFPHIVGLALGGDVDRPAANGSFGSAGGPADPDGDSPFGILRRYR
jgi:hypothetical protein